jgi:lysozyme
MNKFIEIAEQLKIDEGFSSKPYRCSAGKLTWGFGWNIEDLGISKEIANYALYKHIQVCYDQLVKEFDWFLDQSVEVQSILINMCYNMGIIRLKGFKKMLWALKHGDRQEAAIQMIDSKWYKQVGPRAVRLVDIMSEGKLDQSGYTDEVS